MRDFKKYVDNYAEEVKRNLEKFNKTNNKMKRVCENIGIEKIQGWMLLRTMDKLKHGKWDSKLEIACKEVGITKEQGMNLFKGMSELM